MTRRTMGLQFWSDQPSGNMLRAAKGNEKLKCTTLVIKESDSELNGVIKKEKTK